jgi:hypothetical protein
MKPHDDPGVEQARIPPTDDNRPFVRTPEFAGRWTQSRQSQKDYVLL